MNKMLTFWITATGLMCVALYLYLRLLNERLPLLIYSHNMFLIISSIFFLIINFWHLGFGEYLINYLRKFTSSPKPKWFIIRRYLETIMILIMLPFNLIYENLIFNRNLTILLVKYINLCILKTYPHYRLLTILFDILPRFGIIIALWIDIHNGILYYFYQYLALYIIPLLYTILIKIVQKENFKDLKTLKDFQFSWVFNLNFDGLYTSLQKVFFRYHPNVPIHLQDTERFHIVLTFYLITIFESLLLTAKEDILLVILNRLIYFCFFISWWYILFHIMLS